MSDFKNTQDFRKSKLSKHAYQDPTYLSFALMFDFADSANSPFLSKPAEKSKNPFKIWKQQLKKFTA